MTNNHPQWTARIFGAPRVLLRLGIVAFLAAQPAIATHALAANGSPEQPAGTNPDVLKFTPDAGDRMTLGVNIDGQGPYTFIVDSGAEQTVVARELASALDLSVGRTVQVQGLGGSAVTQTVILPSLSIHDITADHIEAPLLLRQDMGAAGVIGLDVLQTHTLVIDFKNNTVAVTTSAKDPDDGESIVIYAHKVMGELVLADARVGDVPVNVIIDTGAQVSIGNDALQRLLFRSRAPLISEAFQVRSATGELTPVTGTVVGGLKIGGMTIANLPIAFADASLFSTLHLSRQPTLLLGMDALQLFGRVSIDFAKRRVTFTKIS